jgi:hypothetical protein
VEMMGDEVMGGRAAADDDWLRVAEFVAPLLLRPRLTQRGILEPIRGEAGPAGGLPEGSQGADSSSGEPAWFTVVRTIGRRQTRCR